MNTNTLYVKIPMKDDCGLGSGFGNIRRAVGREAPQKRVFSGKRSTQCANRAGAV